MSLEWESKSFSDLVDIIGGGTPKTSIDDYWNGNIPWISIKDFNSDQKYVLNTEKTITELGLNNSSTKLLKKDDIIISARGTVGEVAMIKYEMAFNQSCYGLRVHDSLDKDFVYYLLKYNINKLKNMVHGAVFDTITTNTFDNIIVNVPPLEYQKKISYLLSNIDNLIEVKIHENKNLHQQRKLLFKHWFIDFDQFSSYEMKDTTFGLIPKSWEIYDFKEILTKRTEKSNDDSIPMFSVTNTGIHPREDKFNKKLSASTSKFKLIYKNDLVFGMSREILNWGLMDEQIGGVSSAYHIFKINEKKVNPFYLKSFIENYMPYFKDIIKPASREGQGIDQNILMIKQIYVPPENIFKEFYQIDMNYNNLININNNEIEILTQLRNILLPKLMSGEIDVSKVNCE